MEQTSDPSDGALRAAAEASLFDTDVDTDAGSGDDVPRASQPSEPQQLSTPPSKGHKKYESGTEKRHTSVPKLNLDSTLPRSQTFHSFPVDSSPSNDSPTATSPPLTPSTSSSRPRARTRTRTRQARGRPLSVTSATAISPSLMSSSTSAASALANLLAHSPASPQVPGPSDDPSPSVYPSQGTTEGSIDQPVASTITPGLTESSFDRLLSIVTPKNDTVSGALLGVYTPAPPSSAPSDLGARPSQGNPPNFTSNEAASSTTIDTAAPWSTTHTAQVSEAVQLRSFSVHQSKRDTLRPFDLGDDSIDWEFWESVIAEFPKAAQEHPEKLAEAIQAGIPPTLRGTLWQLMSGSKSKELEQFNSDTIAQESRYDKAIKRDLLRTYPDLPYFKPGSPGQEALFNTAKAYALFDDECGYCQGMQFILGPLLLNMADEEAFSTWVHLMTLYDLRGHFTPGMPALELRLYQFSRLLEDLMPRLHAHLLRQGVKPTMFASPWFMTLFCYRFPFDISLRVLDTVFAEGIDSLFRFALLLLEKNETHLLSLDFENAVLFLKDHLLDVYRLPNEPASDQLEMQGLTDETTTNEATSSQDPDSDSVPGLPGALPHAHEGSVKLETTQFFADALVIAQRITDEQLDKYATEHYASLEKSSAPLHEVEELRRTTWNLAARVREMETDLESQQAAHVELMKQVVAATLAKDEVGEQLVQYKTMYAEAILATEQAMSAAEAGVNPNEDEAQERNAITDSTTPGFETESTLLPTTSTHSLPSDVTSAKDKSAASSSGSSMASSVGATVASWGRWMSRGRSARANDTTSVSEETPPVCTNEEDVPSATAAPDQGTPEATQAAAATKEDDGDSTTTPTRPRSPVDASLPDAQELRLEPAQAGV